MQRPSAAASSTPALQSLRLSFVLSFSEFGAEERDNTRINVAPEENKKWVGRLEGDK
jgi:hypothetical protein